MPARISFGLISTSSLACSATNCTKAHSIHSFTKTPPLQCNPDHKNRPTLVLKVFLTNVRSICNKLDLLKAFIDYHRPDILAVTESWGRPTLLDSFLSSDEYVLFRQDRCSDRSGGGVFLLVKKSLVSFFVCRPYI